ncbi:WecB/TagA/CpsF family glycosyltransferase [Paenibacillus eucommiae]|uniref:N-acetylglucosaminyldiphosphoundecaprenol N-acetyl-beta-D-mannosaminyltransferase n=1 Tax=Paenibacillus eucommiae TaxID=1355755 RepID=A0ABS4J514_9BACL|nr:WecB/TagA/CpsF family glycosyltransferase [Paenibacillus eucommiae]MBP1994888.1 N-acetylglucosaminyldiphosphoundecaprenol N-acetyl-beta-D-mannosaminyltransferase [Paenibacillus eucommiae]
MNNVARIMGIPFPKITMEQTLELLGKVIDQDQAGLFHVVTGNPEIVMSCQNDKQLRSIIDEAGLITADGIGIVMVSRIKGGHLPERVTGCDLLIKMLEAGNRKKWSFYFLGADEVTNRRASEVITQTYPNVSVLGGHHGFFSEEEGLKIVEEIRSLEPDVLIVALGAPYAERWIHKHKSSLNAKIAIGVGGSLDIIAGKVKRAPEIWQKLHVEWLFRLINQPSRWRRQMILPRFAIRAIFFKESNK